MDRVRTRDRCIVDARGICAPTPYADRVLTTKLRFDVADEQRILRSRPLNRFEIIGRLVEPVHVAVEHGSDFGIGSSDIGRPRALVLQQPIDRFQRKRVAV